MVEFSGLVSMISLIAYVLFQAQFDADVLRSLVIPLEEESMNLKTCLSEANQRIRELEEEKAKRK